MNAEVTADAEPLNGTPLVGRVQLKSPRGNVVGTAEVRINQVTTPDAQVLADAPAMVGYDLNNAGVMTGDKQIDSQTKPVRWTADRWCRGARARRPRHHRILLRHQRER